MKDEEKEEIRKLIAEFDVAKPASKTSKTGKTSGKASKGSPKTTGSSQAALSPSISSTSGLTGFTGFVGSCLLLSFQAVPLLSERCHPVQPCPHRCQWQRKLKTPVQLVQTQLMPH